MLYAALTLHWIHFFCLSDWFRQLSRQRLMTMIGCLSLQASIQSIASNVQSFTHISPTFYSLNYNYTSGVAYYSNCDFVAGTYNCKNKGSNSFDGLTTQGITQQLTSIGLLTVPAIYAGAANGGTDEGVQNILDNVGNAGVNFIAAMVKEAVSNGYAGYSLLKHRIYLLNDF
jgi:hypothetical protein